MLEIIKKNRFLSHVFFWIGVLSLSVMNGDVFDNFDKYLIMGIAGLIPKIIAAYTLTYLLIPRFFRKKRYLAFSFWFIVSAYLISAFSRFLVVHGAEPFVRTPPFEQESIYEIATDIRWLLIRYFPPTYIMAFFFLLITSIRMNLDVTTLEKEKSEAELKALKAQLNPHFLFNTLNNIYSLSLMSSPKTSESISILSEILDHILYRCNDKYVPLSSEINLIENYIALEKLRYDDRLFVAFIKDIEIEKSIAPLILLSLVENAFKHGAGEDGGSPKISIHLATNTSGLHFTIENTIASFMPTQEKKTIGLGNIRQQLDLLYPKRYQLDIAQTDHLFTVSLQLKKI